MSYDFQILVNRLKEAKINTRRFLKVHANKAAFETEWQYNLYTPEELADYPRRGIAGGDGLVPLEADKHEMVEVLRTVLPPTLEVITPRRQLPHFFFKVLDGEVPNKILHLPNDPEGAGEIRAKNQYFVAAGTTIKFNDLQTGKPKTGTYKIIDDRPIATLTYADFMKAVTPYLGKDSSQKITGEIMENGAEKGTRHAYGIRYATRLIRYEHLDHIAALDILKRWNQKCKPPMPEKDLERMIKNAIVYAQNDPKKNKKPKVNGATTSDGDKRSQADMLILLCLEQKPELFHDQHNTPYARIKQKNVNVIFPIKSRSFKVWLAILLWKEMTKAPSADALAGALNVLQAKALYEGAKHTLYNRVAPASDGFWIDMADENWRAIKVTAAGWQIVDNPPILFKRFSHQKPLATPDRHGDPWGILDFLNIDKNDEATRLLFLCAIISYFIPLIPHVIVVLYGIQGSGKSTLFKIVRRIVDPSAVEVLTLPRNERERVQQLDHHWCAFYDNITSLRTWMSDTLCRAATGGGFTKRELYTNDQDIIYNFKRCVGLNGINIAAQRGDLLDRSLLVGLKDIPKKKRRTEEQLLKDFKACKPLILGGFLNTLVKAIREYPYVQPKELFRMADFTRWGCAIAKALGKTEKDFLKAYETKVKLQIEEAAHSSPVATVLIDYLSNQKKWEGTPSNLYKILLGHAKEMGISTRQKAFPKAPHILVRKLNELAPSLKALGLEVITGIHTGTHRLILINSVSGVKALDEGKNDATDATNASSLSSSSRIDEAFTQLQCVDCRRILNEITPYTFEGGQPFCFTCLNKLKAQKKKYCEHLDLNNQICGHPEGSERGIANTQLCSLTASKNCDLIHPEPKEASW